MWIYTYVHTRVYAHMLDTCPNKPTIQWNISSWIVESFYNTAVNCSNPNRHVPLCDIRTHILHSRQEHLVMYVYAIILYPLMHHVRVSMHVCMYYMCGTSLKYPWGGLEWRSESNLAGDDHMLILISHKTPCHFCSISNTYAILSPHAADVTWHQMKRKRMSTWSTLQLRVLSCGRYMQEAQWMHTRVLDQCQLLQHGSHGRLLIWQFNKRSSAVECAQQQNRLSLFPRPCLHTGEHSRNCVDKCATYFTENENLRARFSGYHQRNRTSIATCVQVTLDVSDNHTAGTLNVSYTLGVVDMQLHWWMQILSTSSSPFDTPA